VQISRVREGTEAFALGVTPLAFIVAVEGRPCKGATAAEVGVLLRNARRPVAMELDAETAYAGLGVGEAFERMAQVCRQSLGHAIVPRPRVFRRKVTLPLA